MDPLFPIIYFILVLISLLTVNTVAREFEKKRPSLIDRKWKRVLWFLSCLIFVPVFVMTVNIPVFILGEVKEFVAEYKKLEGQEKREQ